MNMIPTVKVFRLFLASPDEARKLVKPSICEIVYEWNRTQGEIFDIRIEVCDWTTHSPLQYGKRPQEIVNTKVLDKCDIILPVFWKKIGSPTGVDISGTVEEIKRAIKNKKPIMLYFCDKPAKPSEIRNADIKKIKQLKKQYRKKGLCCTFTSITEFKEYFRIHLSDMMQLIIKRYKRRTKRKKGK